MDLIFDQRWFDPADKFCCVVCDAPIEPIQLAIYGLVNERADHVTQFFKGDFDSLDCLTCGYPTGYMRTVALLIPEQNALIVQLGNFPGSQQLQEHFEGSLRSNANDLREVPTVIRCTSGMEVRRVYGKMYRHNIQAVVTAMNRGLSSVQSNLAILTPRSFLAAAFALFGLLPGVGVKAAEEGIDREQVEQDLAEAQALTWFLALQESLKAFDHPDGGFKTLEQLLQQNFDGGLSSSAAVSEFEAMRDKFYTAIGEASNGLPLEVFQYIFEAGTASIYAGRPDENPSKTAWAKSYFRFEVTTRFYQKESVRRALALTPGRTAATLSYIESVDAIGRILQTNHEANGVINEIANDLGFTGLLDEVVQGMTIEGIEDHHEIWLDLSKDLLAEGMSLGSVLAFSSKALALLTERRADRDPIDQFRELESFADALINHIAANFAQKISINVWLASHLKTLGLPQLALSRLGEEESDRESELEALAKLSLWTERFNALRLAGRSERALELALKIEASLSAEISEVDRRVAKRNLGIAMRETGDPAGSLSAFRELDMTLRRVNASFEEQLDNLDSLCISSAILGNHKETLDAAERGMHLSVGQNSRFKPRFIVHMTSALIAHGKYAQARTLLKEQTATLDGQKVEVIGLWLHLWVNDQVGPDEQELVEEISRALPVAEKVASESGDMLRLLGALITSAQLAQIRGAPNAEESWRKIVEVAQDRNLVVPPEALVRLATFAFQGNKPEAGMDFLKDVPASLADRVGKSPMLELKSSSRSLESVLRSLINCLALRSEHWNHMRFAVDLGRDLHWKSTLLRSSRIAERITLLRLLETGFDDSILSSLKLDQGSLLVLEWIPIEGYLHGSCSVIGSDGSVVTQWIDLPDFDLVELGERIRARLDGWSSLFQGEPFDVPEWEAFESWFLRLCSSFPDVQRVLIIEHEQLRHLPFHVLGKDKIRVSYSSSWCQVLLSGQPGTDVGNSILGLGTALQRGDGAEVLFAAQSSSKATQDLAARTSLELLAAVDADLDQGRINELLAKSDLLKLICHGFVLPNREIAFVLAHWRRLPPRSLSLATPMGRGHIVGLPELQGVSRSPRTIWSGACSSGVNSFGETGDKLGVFSLLRTVGLRAYVAPRWDVEPEYVLPILDSAIGFFVEENLCLGDAVCKACAESNAPKWLAWSLAVEGSWEVKWSVESDHL